MPAHRKPSNVLELNGAFKHDPSRGAARADEPQLQSVDPRTLAVPFGLSEIEALAWHEITPRVPAQTFTQADVPALVMMARLYSRVLFDPWLDVKVAGSFLRYLALFGMTPADRSRVKVIGNAPKTDPDDEFFGAGSAA